MKKGMSNVGWVLVVAILLLIIAVVVLVMSGKAGVFLRDVSLI